MDVFADTVTGMEILYQGRTLEGIIFDEATANVWNTVAQDLELEPLISDPDWSLEFDIPEHYRNLDVETMLLDQAQELGIKETLRVVQELEMFKARNLIPVLQLMIYIVDTMRKNNVFWGVGRGSSVASYCLYLLGVHKVDSMKYELPISEFLK
jgi:DNA polymerase III alpha subunit